MGTNYNTAMAMRKVTYRLYPSRTQAAALAGLLRHHQGLYNACLQQRIEAWDRRRANVGYRQQCAELTDLRRVSRVGDGELFVAADHAPAPR